MNKSPCYAGSKGFYCYLFNSFIARTGVQLLEAYCSELDTGPFDDRAVAGAFSARQRGKFGRAQLQRHVVGAAHQFLDIRIGVLTA